jgi:formylglycine-generating enzyme required for sulfatase activity
MLVSGLYSQTRVLRGGGAGFRENECRSSTRWFLKPHSSRHYIGFRVVVELPESPSE